MAVDSSGKKRKRASEKHDRPSKKATAVPVVPPLKVDYVHNQDGAAPVIASTPGVHLSESVALDAYSKQRSKRNKSVTENADVASSELLLHSSSHPKLDFTGKEAENDLDNLWDHYVAVYDPERGTLQLTEARKMTVRACIRQHSPEAEEEMDEEAAAAPSAFSQRTALAETFGTKQSKKAVQSIQENALLSGGPGGPPSAAETALLSSMPKNETSSSPQKSAQEEIQAAKPLPQPNLAANHPSQVYSIESLVPNGLSTLSQMPIGDWEQALAASESVTTSSRFVSSRIEAAARSEDKMQLQILRFIIMLLELSKSLKSSRGGPGGKAGPGSKKLPPREELRQVLSSTTGSHDAESDNAPPTIADSLLETIRRKFVPQGSFLAKNDITFLHTTICALSLHIPPPGGFAPNELATDPSHLRDDLRLENQIVMQYFRELGCRIDKPKENEYARWGIKKGKAEAGAMRIARLRLPVEFPKVSRGGGAGRRK